MGVDGLHPREDPRLGAGPAEEALDEEWCHSGGEQVGVEGVPGGVGRNPAVVVRDDLRRPRFLDAVLENIVEPLVAKSLAQAGAEDKVIARGLVGQAVLPGLEPVQGELGKDDLPGLAPLGLTDAVLALVRLDDLATAGLEVDGGPSEGAELPGPHA